MVVPMQITARINSNIVIDPNLLPVPARNHILEALTIKNPEKDRAIKEMLYNAHYMPDTIKLYKSGYEQWIFPRGFVFQFEKILKESDIEINWITDLIYQEFNSLSFSDDGLRAYQEDAKSKLILYANGIYKAPTGAGKTRVMLSIIKDCQQKTIVFVEKLDLIDQWSKAADDLSVTNLDIVTRQSIWNTYKNGYLEQSWFDQYGMVVIDECHHVSNDTFWEIIQRFKAYYRFGCSATPDSDEEIFPIARAVIGPVVHETLAEDTGEALVIPEVHVVPTSFDFEYVPTHKECNPKTGKMKVVRNNYADMMTALENDHERNTEILACALQDATVGHHCIIVSKRKNHLNNIMRILYDTFTPRRGPSGFLYIENDGIVVHLNTFTGHNSSESREIKDRINLYEHGSILFSTLAEEGTDIPKLDRLFLTYPGRKIRPFEQAIGRIMRSHPDKQDAIVYDFRDLHIGLLNSQFRERAQMIYGKRNYKVTVKQVLQPTV